MAQWVDWSKTARSRDYRGSGSFATFMIIGPTCFFLGILFASFPYDFPLLWSKEPVSDSYYDQLETHLKFMHQAPPLIGRLLNMIITVGFLGLFLKLFRPSEANFLFDGASLILYVIGVAVYISNIVTGLRTVSSGLWHTEEWKDQVANPPEVGEAALGREDSLKVMAASNTIVALVFIGVLVLQTGQWYAERKELEDEKLERERELKREDSTASGRGGSKKKQ